MMLNHSIPACTRGKNQLSLEEVERSKRLSRVCIHVERVTGLLKQKYTILEGPLPVNLIKHKSDGEYAIVDKILTVCAALTNLCDSVVSWFTSTVSAILYCMHTIIHINVVLTMLLIVLDICICVE